MTTSHYVKPCQWTGERKNFLAGFERIYCIVRGPMERNTQQGTVDGLEKLRGTAWTARRNMKTKSLKLLEANLSLVEPLMRPQPQMMPGLQTGDSGAEGPS